MASRYAVRTVILESGERLPLLIDCDTGSPLFEPTLYALTELRGRGRASATIEQALRAVMVLHRFLDTRGVALDVRLAEGRLLTLGEIEELTRHCRLPIAAFGENCDPGLAAKPLSGRASSLEKLRMRSKGTNSLGLDPSSVAVRLRYIRDYIRWAATDRLLSIEPDHPTHAALFTESQIVVRVLGERIPSSAAKDFVGQRQGLSLDASARLNQVIDPLSLNNPWKGVHARERNALLVHWLQSLGLRRGELLGVRIANINFQANEVRITRHADDRSDPRVRQPNTKTHGRLVPLDEPLAQLTRHYILNTRRALVGALKHDYLFVANGSGAPLTLAAVDHVFATLRRKCPDIPPDLTAHVLRHTWNDRFSELMDEKSVPEELEQKLRSRLMGWSETSRTARTYTRRHVQRRAREVSIELQRTLVKAKTP